MSSTDLAGEFVELPGLETCEVPTVPAWVSSPCSPELQVALSPSANLDLTLGFGDTQFLLESPSNEETCEYTWGCPEAPLGKNSLASILSEMPRDYVGNDDWAQDFLAQLQDPETHKDKQLFEPSPEPPLALVIEPQDDLFDSDLFGFVNAPTELSPQELEQEEEEEEEVSTLVPVIQIPRKPLAVRELQRPQALRDKMRVMTTINRYFDRRGLREYSPVDIFQIAAGLKTIRHNSWFIMPNTVKELLRKC